MEHLGKTEFPWSKSESKLSQLENVARPQHELPESEH